MNDTKRRLLTIAIRYALAITLMAVIPGLAPAEALGKRLILGAPLYAEDALLPDDFLKQLNAILEPDDIVFMRPSGPWNRSLDWVKRGKVAVIRQSIPALEKDLRILRSAGTRLNYLGYNPEQWPTSHTPPEEKRDMVKAAGKVRALAERERLGLVIIPDSDKSLFEIGGQLARHADVFGIQLQRWQALPPNEFRLKTLEAVRIVREGNPKAMILAQISTNPPAAKRGKQGKGHAAMSVEEMLARVRAMEDAVDGVVFLIKAEENGFGRFLEFARRFRPAR